MTREASAEVPAAAPRELPLTSSWRSGGPEWLAQQQKVKQGAAAAGLASKWPKLERVAKQPLAESATAAVPDEAT